MRTSPRSGVASEAVVFFLDRCLGKGDVRQALSDAGARVEIFDAHFDQDTNDVVWLREVAKRGWIVLTKDKHLRSNPLEVRALFESGTATFVLSSGEVTGPQMGIAFVNALPDMRRFLAKFQKPFVASVTSTGKVRVVENYASLIRKLP